MIKNIFLNSKKIITSTLAGFLNRFAADSFPLLIPLVIAMNIMDSSVLNLSIAAFYLGSILAIVGMLYLLAKFSYSYAIRTSLALLGLSACLYLVCSFHSEAIVIARFFQGLGVGFLPILIKTVLVKKEQNKPNYSTSSLGMMLAKTNLLFPLLPFAIFLIVGLVMKTNFAFELCGIVILISAVPLLFYDYSTQDNKEKAVDAKQKLASIYNNIKTLIQHESILFYSLCFGLTASFIPVYYYSINYHFAQQPAIDNIRYYGLLAAPAVGLLLSRIINITFLKKMSIQKIIRNSLGLLFILNIVQLSLDLSGNLNSHLFMLFTILEFINIGLITSLLTAKILSFFKEKTLELLLIATSFLYLFSWLNTHLNIIFAKDDLLLLCLFNVCFSVLALGSFFIAKSIKKSGVSIARTEWRGEFFSSDNLPFLNNPALKKLPFSAKYTLTAYFKNAKGELCSNPSVRFRTYISLPELSETGVNDFFARNIVHGTLQIKESTGQKYELCDAVITKLEQAEGRYGIVYNDNTYYLSSIKIAEREHFIKDTTSTSQKSGDTFQPRLTIDYRRHTFIVNDKGHFIWLGDLGKRLEYKHQAEEQLAEFLNLMGNVPYLPSLEYRSFELLFQNLLREKVAYKNKFNIPEIEKKYSLVTHDQRENLAAIVQFIKSQPQYEFTLPHPHVFSRSRRYYLCESLTDKKSQYTIVETAAGKFSIKIKANTRSTNGTLIRDTVASYTTDIDGEASLDQLLEKHNLKIINCFIKQQYKIAFNDNDGSTFIFSLDSCDDGARSLYELELEYSGEQAKDSKITTNIVLNKIDAIEKNMRHHLSNIAWQTSKTKSKFNYFTEGLLVGTAASRSHLTARKKAA